MKRTYVYIDSFNLYFGALKKLPKFKWFNVETWVKLIVPIATHDIQKIKYFTARVSAQDNDPQKPVRQDMYFRALRTISLIEIIWGKYKPKTVKVDISKDIKMLVKKFEEKGTDVNLGTHLVNDAHLNKFDVAVIVSNDSDLSEAVKIVCSEIGKEVWVINPCLGSPSNKTLTKHATEIRVLREGQVKVSQFQSPMTDSVGSFTKPASW